MNLLLWVLQVLLALYYMMGGIYQASNYGKLSKAVAYMKVFPKPAWITLGLLQALLALALVVPSLSPIAAACLALQALLVSALHVKYGSFGSILWILLPGILAGFVAYGRYVLLPL
jgi:uncharacterized membrane protein YphA (DoxX/SURF4 family)